MSLLSSHLKLKTNSYFNPEMPPIVTKRKPNQENTEIERKTIKKAKCIEPSKLKQSSEVTEKKTLSSRGTKNKSVKKTAKVAQEVIKKLHWSPNEKADLRKAVESFRNKTID